MGEAYRSHDPDAGAGNTSIDLLKRYREGDESALRRLLERQIRPMQTWAHGRLPRWARDHMDTDDIVQDVLLRTVTRLAHFEPRHDGALQSYLRQAVLHRIRDEIRRSRRTPARDPLDSASPADDPSPEEEAEALELFEAYESALARLKNSDREAIVLRVELELPYREIAQVLGKSSVEAAQMAVGRALLRLAREMGRA